MPALREKPLQLLQRQLGICPSRLDVPPYGSLGQGALGVLQGEEALLDGVSADEAVHVDVAGLAQAVYAVDGLRAGRGERE